MIELTGKGEMLLEIVRKRKAREPLTVDERELLDQLRVAMFGYFTDDKVEEADQVASSLIEAVYTVPALIR